MKELKRQIMQMSMKPVSLGMKKELVLMIWEILLSMTGNLEGKGVKLTSFKYASFLY